MHRTAPAWRAPRFNNTRPFYSSPATTHQWHFPNFRPSYSSLNNSPYRQNQPPSKPYQGFCQICGIQGHTVKRCPSFKLIPIHSSATEHSSAQHSTSFWQPQANFFTNTASPDPTWLLDSGASHHVTANLENLSLHSPYNSHDDVMIGDGTSLSITHTSSTKISSPHSTFKLSNVLCVPTMKRNLISVYQFCNSNNVSVEFFSIFFIDLPTYSKYNSPLPRLTNQYYPPP